MEFVQVCKCCKLPEAEAIEHHAEIEKTQKEEELRRKEDERKFKERKDAKLTIMWNAIERKTAIVNQIEIDIWRITKDSRSINWGLQNVLNFQQQYEFSKPVLKAFDKHLDSAAKVIAEEKKRLEKTLEYEFQELTLLKSNYNDFKNA